WFFKTGELTALVAIMLYAIVPPIRYVEHGIRNVRPDVVEAARQIGCTPAQLLWQVKLPMAMPVVMLGLNQTIMAGLSMLVIAAMGGTTGLGQQVYKALGKADAVRGPHAGPRPPPGGEDRRPPHRGRGRAPAGPAQAVSGKRRETGRRRRSGPPQ